MNHYLLLKIAHSLPGVLVLLGLLAHLFMLWKAQRSGDTVVLQRKLRNTRVYSLPALGLLGLGLEEFGLLEAEPTGWGLFKGGLAGRGRAAGALPGWGVMLEGGLRPPPRGLRRSARHSVFV